jgi:hypothetical protein
MVLEIKLQPLGLPQPPPYMTPEQYHTFAKNFQEQVRPALDQQRLARIHAEEAAKKYLITH